MHNENILIYSSVAGELVNIVRNKQAECFVKWEDYQELKKYAEGLEENLNERIPD